MSVHFVDMSGYPFVRMTGKESLDLLQRISTNDLTPLKSGERAQNLLTNDKGKIVDAVSIFPLGIDDLLLAGSNPSPSTLKGWIEKFIIMEEITIKDVTSENFALLLFGSNQELQELEHRIGPNCVRETWAGTLLLRMIGEKAQFDYVIRNLSSLGVGRELPGMFEEYRISNGIPAFPCELSTSYNPLEAGLNHLISWTKGCYVGQEVIARLDTYKKVQRKLVRFRLDNHPRALPAAIMSGAEEAGLLTSLSTIRGVGGFAGLGYLKTAHLNRLESLSISQAGQNIRVEPALE
jgi:folate-binding protein YgfZ